MGLFKNIFQAVSSFISAFVSKLNVQEKSEAARDFLGEKFSNAIALLSQAPEVSREVYNSVSARLFSAPAKAEEKEEVRGRSPRRNPARGSRYNGSYN